MKPSFEEFVFAQYMLINGMHEPRLLPPQDLAKWKAKFAAKPPSPEVMELLEAKYELLHPDDDAASQ